MVCWHCPAIPLLVLAHGHCCSLLACVWPEHLQYDMLFVACFTFVCLLPLSHMCCVLLCCVQVVYVFTTELYPSSCRTSGLCTAGAMSRLAGIATSYFSTDLSTPVWYVHAASNACMLCVPLLITLCVCCASMSLVCCCTQLVVGWPSVLC